MKAFDMIILLSVALLALLLAACADQSNPVPATGAGAGDAKTNTKADAKTNPGADPKAGKEAAHTGHGGHAAAGRKPNRLIHETSPYLLQHAHNPVDWRPWGKEAFEAARKEDKPIFLSVGYSTCHWCHVMAHESFEDEKVAEILNKHFISIKVDREELPEIDAQYMLATQMLVRRGGWPNSVWLTPDGRPWQAGTYFPREDQVLQGRVVRTGFKTVLLQLADIWKNRRAEVEELGTQLAADIQRYGKGEHLGAGRPVGRGIIEKAGKLVAAGFDSERAGFGSPPNFAPKFPPHGALALLSHTATAASAPDLTTLDKLGRTLDAMALGGMYDHVGGGFHRYSTDRRWFLPHFEKMLYDNAQLMRAYADGAVILSEPGYRVVIEEIFTWLGREMTDPSGGFYSALDADSEGEEGRFYVWSIAEMKKILGEADAKLMVEIYGATEAGNFMDEASHQRNGTNVLYLERSLERIAAQRKEEPAAFVKRVNELKGKLLAVRNQRIRPHLDDKVLAGWNGLMIGSLAHAGRTLKEPRYKQAGAKAADFILKSMRGPDGRLLRTWRKGQAKVDGYLDDYAFLMHGLLELHTATGEKRWLDEAAALAAAMKKRFTDQERGGFHFTSDLHPVSLIRAEDPTSGGNTPSGNGMAAQALIMLFEKTGDKAYIAMAEGIFNRFAGHLWEMPNAVEDMVVALARYYALIDAGKIQEPKREHFKIKPDSEQYIEPVAVGAYLDAMAVRPGAKVKLAILLQVGSEWHLYANKQPAGSMVIPTVVSLSPGGALKLGEVRYPAGELVKDPAQAYQAYRGLTTVMAEIAIPADAKPGEQVVNLIVKFQACNDITRTCLLPEETKLELRLKIAADAPQQSDRHKEIFKAAAQ